MTENRIQGKSQVWGKDLVPVGDSSHRGPAGLEIWNDRGMAVTTPWAWRSQPRETVGCAKTQNRTEPGEQSTKGEKRKGPCWGEGGEVDGRNRVWKLQRRQRVTRKEQQIRQRSGGVGTALGFGR